MLIRQNPVDAHIGLRDLTLLGIPSGIVLDDLPGLGDEALSLNSAGDLAGVELAQVPE